MKKEKEKESSQGLKPGYENSVISQPVCLGLTNLVATCLKTQKLGHIAPIFIQRLFFPKCRSTLVNSKGIERDLGRPASGEGVHSDRDCERFLNSPRSRRVVPSEGLALDKDYKQLWTSPTLCLLLALLRSEAAVIL